MDTFIHETVPTQFIDVNGTNYAYRRFGKKAGLPLVFLQHFTGTLDNWDPAVTDVIALEREVILFDNAGVAASTGEVADTIKGIATTAIAFIDGLGLEQIDLFGYSMGSFVAQEITLARPELIRKLILVGSGPRGGEGMASFSPEALAMFAATYDPADELLLATLFSPTETSQASGRAFLDRIRSRTIDRDTDINEKVAPAQLAAIAEWGTPGDSTYSYLKNINIPVLIVNGKVDVLFPTVNSYLLQQHLSKAKLVLYPDSNHGSQYQFHEDFVREVSWFLNN